MKYLVAARALSVAGDSLSLVALMLHVASTTGQALAVAVLLLVGDFAPALLGPLTGAVADRFDRRRVMIACELVQAAAVGALALTLPALPWLLVLVAVRAVAAQVFLPASRAVLPALVPDAELPAANSTLGLATNAAEVAGPFLAAGLLPFIHTRGVLAVDAVSFLLSALLLVFLEGTSSAPRSAGLLTDARAGLGHLLRTPVLRTVVLGFCGVVAFNGVDDVALVVLGGTGPRAGLLLGATGVGLLLGYALLGRFGTAWGPRLLILTGFAVNSLGNLLTGAAAAVFGAAFAAQAVRGAGIAAMDVGTNTALQRLVPDHLLGRAFGNLYGAVGVAAALSYLAGAVLLDGTSAALTLVSAGAGGLAVTAATALALRTWPAPSRIER
ncbi:putative MFS-type transporter YfiS [Virgisporangium aliadipatigenens]|uniref:Putative MFS-type transporter YfiS n=1 Tax=Virgisporangium aliadipatigenens TaxID=741659 RepID=A0A8J3YV71_9ACTN|nr:MFS transporter [Virgisporangium aliadipatigenens]GIJ50420.1 putative MFS-type transporter YfiS [Virgisporangium aliadipatigenens]